MKLILSICLLFLVGCKSNKGYKMYFEMEHGTGEAHGWMEIDGVRHDISIIRY